MMSYSSDELVWNFIGYLHVNKELSSLPFYFDAFSFGHGEEPLSGIKISAYAASATDSAPSPDSVAQAPVEFVPSPFQQFEYAGFARAPVVLRHGEEQERDETADARPSVEPPVLFAPAPRFIIPDAPTITLNVTYETIGPIADSVLISQSSGLFDNDTVIIDGVTIGVSQDEVDILVEEGLGLAEDLVSPEEITLDPSGFAGTTMVRYVNGEKVAIDADNGYEIGSDDDTEGLELPDVLSQFIQTGGNTLLNSAVVTDGPTGSLGGSTEIIQENTASDEDEVLDAVVQNTGTVIQEISSAEEAKEGVSASAVTQEIVSGQNIQSNSVAVTTESDGSDSGPDIGTVQSNLLSDDDIISDATVSNGGEVVQTVEASLSEDVNSQSTATAEAGTVAQTIETGQNVQVNETEILATTSDEPDFPDIGIDQTNEVEDEDLLDGAQVSNEGSISQTVTATAGTAIVVTDETGAEETADDEAEGDDNPEGADDPVSDAQILAAELGDNEINQDATILDIGSDSTGLIVHGDHHTTTEIIQTIIMIDEDHVDVLADEDADVDVEESGNTAVNDASWIESASPLVSTGSGSTYAAVNWNVDIVTGDVVESTMLVQESLIHDNDVVYQTTTEISSEFSLGENLVGQEAQSIEFSSQYDLIIVLGNYYSEYSITQTSILFDSDTVYVEHDGTSDLDETDAEIGIETSGNSSLNSASILTFGYSESFAEFDDAVAELSENLANQNDEFEADLELVSNLSSGYDGTFDVLFVEGDYYETNSIIQTSIITDMDFYYSQAIGSDGDAENGLIEQSTEDLPVEDMDETDFNSLLQEVSTGGNSQTNTASIIDGGYDTDSQYVGGDVYSSDFLHQAELVVASVDEIVNLVLPEVPVSLSSVDSESINVDINNTISSTLDSLTNGDSITGYLA